MDPGYGAGYVDVYGTDEIEVVVDRTELGKRKTVSVGENRSRVIGKLQGKCLWRMWKESMNMTLEGIKSMSDSQQ